MTAAATERTADKTTGHGGLCRVNLLGPFRLSGPDGQPIAIQGRRTRALLGYLLLAAQQSAGRERLAGLFWSDRTEAQSRSSLRQCLLELRGALAATGEDLMIATRETVTLAPGAFACDVIDLRAALVAHDWDAAARLVNDAATAPLLEDLELRGPYGEWLDTTRAEIDAGIAAGLARHITARESAGDWAAVKALANAWLRRDPLSEPAVAALIRGEIATGARAAAHIRFQAFRAQLAAEIGVEPGPLVDAALRGEGGEVPLPPPPALRDEPLILAEPALAEPASAAMVLAVLAFDNLSSDPELADFCDGVSEEIQRTVARGTDIAVVARASSHQFRGADKGIDKVSAALGASHVLDGSVRRSGKRVRISAELVACQSQRVLWSERFDGDVEDVFGLQDSIAERVAQALERTLSPRRLATPLEPATYELFLRARALFAGGDPHYDDTAQKALPLLEAVTREAPDHAPAWELLAIARAWLLRSGRSDQPYAEGRAGVVVAAETALRLDPKHGGAYSALAMLEPWGAYCAREALLQKALDSGPSDPVALTDMSAFCFSVGRFRDALRHAERACTLNPLMPAAQLLVAQMRTYVGDYEASLRMYLEQRARWPNNPSILHFLINTAPILEFWEVYDAVVGDIDRFEGWIARDMQASRTFAETLRDRDPEKISRRIARYVDLLDRTGTLPLNLLVAISALGEVDMALDLAERASYAFVFDTDGARPGLFEGTILARWSGVVTKPRFVKLCARLGLCTYWLETGKWPDLVDWAPYDFKAEVRRIGAG